MTYLKHFKIFIFPGLFCFIIGCAGFQDGSQSAPSALYNKGIRLVNKGHYEEAKEIFHQYIAEYPDSHLYLVSLYQLGFCYQKLGDTKQALTIYHKVLDEDAQDFWGQMAQKRIKEMETSAGEN